MLKAYQRLIFFKMSFPPLNYDVFLQKNQEFFQVGKIRNYERVFFRERKRFHLSKSLPYKNGKAEIRPVLAGRLVIFF